MLRWFQLGHQQGFRVDVDDFPPRLLCIADGRSRPTPLLTVVNGDQEGGRINKTLVSFYTNFQLKQDKAQERAVML